MMHQKHISHAQDPALCSFSYLSPVILSSTYVITSFYPSSFRLGVCDGLADHPPHTRRLGYKAGCPLI